MSGSGTITYSNDSGLIHYRGVDYGKSRAGGSSQLTGTSGNRDGDNLLRIVHDRTVGLFLNGHQDYGRRYFSGYPCLVPGPQTPNFPSPQALAAQLVAGTNPSRAEIQLPVFFLELRELPMMIRQVGRVLLGLRRPGEAFSGLNPKNQARANLAVQFGWMPLISDFFTMYDYVNSVERRLNELDRLQSSSGLKRRQTLYTGSTAPYVTNHVVHSGQALTLRHEFITSSRTKCWGTVRWMWNDRFPRRTYGLPYVRRLVGGLTAGQQLKNLWDVIPWSWLIDWFSTTGDLIGARSNSIPAYPDRICIMRHFLSEVVPQSPIVGTWGPLEIVTISGGKRWKEYKYRDPVPSLGLPTASLPILGAKQLSILGSLAITRI